MTMGMADLAEVLWNNFLRHNPSDPKWPNRDRFILSNGHGSMLLYALLHLSGYDLSVDDLKNFRQLNSKTPGHPEYEVTPGVEITTGPLGQGLASAVGMALAERLLASKFNRKNYNIVDNYTYCFVGDGCLMEGISHEACSLAGSLGLGKLILFWDNNNVSLDGPVTDCCIDNIEQRFLAYNWQVISDLDGHDATEIKNAIVKAKENNNQPSIICCKTIIGYGSPNLSGIAKCHGSPLGEEEIKLVRKELKWNLPEFVISDEIYKAWDAKEKGNKYEQEWQKLFTLYQQEYPELAQEFNRRIHGKLPDNWDKEWNGFINSLQQENISLATREGSKKTLDFLGNILPELIGGAADLSSSNLTMHKSAEVVATDQNNISGNYINYGVREFAMAAIMNGLSLYGGIIPYGGTFLVFSDYARPAIRLSALMKKKVIYVFTHDSIAVGEDGPTHQPIEQLSSLRIMPNVSLWRPADLIETAIAWKMAIERDNSPTVLALTRQKVSEQKRSLQQIEQIQYGGYILKDSKDKPEIILLATGSEVELAMQAADLLIKQDKYSIRVVSMPSVDTFMSQNQPYKEQILPKNIFKIVIESGITNYWYQIIQGNGTIIGIDHYGQSAPGQQLRKIFDLTVEKIIKTVREFLQ